MILVNSEVWVIITKDKKMIAKGVPRNRYLVPIDDLKDKKRILTYSSEKTAIANFTNSGFYNKGKYKQEDFEAVKANLTLEV